MTELKNMLIIGGAARNVGKTELVCGLVRKFSGDHEIISLKVSGINPGHEPHGNHGPPPDKFHLLEETSRDGLKDSSRMLVSGAARSFYLRTRDEFLGEAVEHFFTVVDKGAVIICESIALRKIILPGLFVIIRGDMENDVKKGLGDVLHLADLSIVSNGRTFDPPLDVISLDRRGWRLK
jgi:hypothetical protein